MGLSAVFLVVSLSTRTTRSFGLAAWGIGYQQGLVALDEDAFALLLRSLIRGFLVTGHQDFGDGLADCINVGHVITTLTTDLEVHPGNLLLAQRQVPIA